nr:ATP-binding cassette domain-containing protein [Lactobacillus helveticus]
MQGKFYDAADDINLTLKRDEILAIVGESGCGKSTIASSIIGLYDHKNTKVTGDILYNELNLVGLNESLFNKIRGDKIGMIFQDPLASLNPLMRVGDQVAETLEPITRNYIQQWKKIGLNVKLTTGRLIEFNSFYDKIQNDAKDVDVFMAAWSLASEPSPNDFYNEKAPFNFTRFVTKKNTQLLAEMDSQKAFNHKYRVDKFHEWQKYMNDEAYVVPTTNSYAITAVNSKITGYSLKPSDGNSLWYKVGYAK